MLSFVVTILKVLYLRVQGQEPEAVCNLRCSISLTKSVQSSQLCVWRNLLSLKHFQGLLSAVQDCLPCELFRTAVYVQLQMQDSVCLSLVRGGLLLL